MDEINYHRLLFSGIFYHTFWTFSYNSFLLLQETLHFSSPQTFSITLRSGQRLGCSATLVIRCSRNNTFIKLDESDASGYYPAEIFIALAYFLWHAQLPTNFYIQIYPQYFVRRIRPVRPTSCQENPHTPAFVVNLMRIFFPFDYFWFVALRYSSLFFLTSCLPQFL